MRQINVQATGRRGANAVVVLSEGGSLQYVHVNPLSRRLDYAKANGVVLGTLAIVVWAVDALVLWPS